MSALTDAKMEEYYFAQLVLASTNSKTNERDSKKDFYEWWDDEHLPAKGAQKITWGTPESMTRFSDPDYAKLLDEKSGRRKRKAIVDPGNEFENHGSTKSYCSCKTSFLTSVLNVTEVSFAGRFPLPIHWSHVT